MAKQTTKEVDLNATLPQSIDLVEDTLEKFLEVASVEAVYGEPVQHADQIVIPCAEIVCGLGFGMGTGFGSDEGKSENGEPKKNIGGGVGGGGGGHVLSRPVAVIVASSEGVRVEPVVDVTKVALAALTAGGFMVGMLLRMVHPRK
jgi:uncharacterized spore protein YtfJ